MLFTSLLIFSLFLYIPRNGDHDHRVYSAEAFTFSVGKTRARRYYHQHGTLTTKTTAGQIRRDSNSTLNLSLLSPHYPAYTLSLQSKNKSSRRPHQAEESTTELSASSSSSSSETTPQSEKEPSSSKQSLPWRQSLRLGFQAMISYIALRGLFELLLAMRRNIIKATTALVALSCGTFLVNKMRLQQKKQEKKSVGNKINGENLNSVRGINGDTSKPNGEKKVVHEDANGDYIKNNEYYKDVVSLPTSSKTAKSSTDATPKSSSYSVTKTTKNNSNIKNNQKYTTATEEAAKQWALSTLNSTKQQQEKAQQQRLREKEQERKNQLWVESVAKRSGINLPNYKRHYEISEQNGKIVWNGGSGNDRTVAKGSVFNAVREKEEREKRAASLWVSNAMRGSTVPVSLSSYSSSPQTSKKMPENDNVE